MGEFTADFVRKYGKAQPYDPGTFSDLASTKAGRRLWEFLNGAESVIRMETATFLRRPAVEPLAPFLLEEFGDDIRADRWKQLVGHMTRQVMKRLGYRLDAQGIRIRRGGLFTSGSRYVAG